MLFSPQLDENVGLIDQNAFFNHSACIQTLVKQKYVHHFWPVAVDSDGCINTWWQIFNSLNFKSKYFHERL